LFSRTNRAKYRAEVLGDVPRIGIESRSGGANWARWLGDSGEFVGMNRFSVASAPAEVLYREFGITADAVAKSGAALQSRDQRWRAA